MALESSRKNKFFLALDTVELSEFGVQRAAVALAIAVV
jgi:hypothetical protein